MTKYEAAPLKGKGFDDTSITEIVRTLSERGEAFPLDELKSYAYQVATIALEGSEAARSYLVDGLSDLGGSCPYVHIEDKNLSGLLDVIHLLQEVYYDKTGNEIKVKDLRE